MSVAAGAHQGTPLREYADAVFAASESFISSADTTTLNRPIDLSFIGLGIIPLSLAFEGLVVGHCNQFAGEISAIKGTFGLKGYPF